MASLIAAGSGLGPVLAGLIFDHYDSCGPFLVLGVIGSVVASALIMSPGSYPDWMRRVAPAAAPAAA